MWIKTSKGNIIGEKCGYFATDKHQIIYSPLVTDDEYTIKTFDNAEDAQNYLDELYDALTFNGWVTDAKGVLRNLNMAHKIEVGTSAGKSKVFATFALSGEKINDPAFYEMATLATFDREEEAVIFLGSLKKRLNGVL